MDEAFHLVCHECPEEGVYDDRSAAESARQRHERDADHRMSLLEIATPNGDRRDIEQSA